jgi:hypothetical protein
MANGGRRQPSSRRGRGTARGGLGRVPQRSAPGRLRGRSARPRRRDRGGDREHGACPGRDSAAGRAGALLRGDLRHPGPCAHPHPANSPGDAGARPHASRPRPSARDAPTGGGRSRSDPPDRRARRRRRDHRHRLGPRLNPPAAAARRSGRARHRPNAPGSDRGALPAVRQQPPRPLRHPGGDDVPRQPRRSGLHAPGDGAVHGRLSRDRRSLRRAPASHAGIGGRGDDRGAARHGRAAECRHRSAGRGGDRGLARSRVPARQDASPRPNRRVQRADRRGPRPAARARSAAGRCAAFRCCRARATPAR